MASASPSPAPPRQKTAQTESDICLRQGFSYQSNILGIFSAVPAGSWFLVWEARIGRNESPVWDRVERGSKTQDKEEECSPSHGGSRPV